jgi:DnaK suppressor protein
MMGPRDIAAFEDRLKARLTELNEALRHSADAAQAVALDQSSVGRLSRMDALQQQATRLGLREGLQEELSRERLGADPAAPFCMDCEVEIKGRERGR